MSAPVHLRYGHTGLDVRLPPHARPVVIGKRPLAKLADPHAAVRAALAGPVSCAPYADLVQGRRSACILVCDITRPVPNGLFLRPMIEAMLGAGIPADRITVLVATGLHRPNEGAELAEVIGDPWVEATVRVENHFARDAAAHVDLGATPTRRTPVKLDRRFVDADLRIATGLVEPHFMAGWSGGSFMSIISATASRILLRSSLKPPAWASGSLCISSISRLRACSAPSTTYRSAR